MTAWPPSGSMEVIYGTYDKLECCSEWGNWLDVDTDIKFNEASSEWGRGQLSAAIIMRRTLVSEATSVRKTREPETLYRSVCCRSFQFFCKSGSETSQLLKNVQSWICLMFKKIMQSFSLCQITHWMLWVCFLEIQLLWSSCNLWKIFMKLWRTL